MLYTNAPPSVASETHTYTHAITSINSMNVSSQARKSRSSTSETQAESRSQLATLQDEQVELRAQLDAAQMQLDEERTAKADLQTANAELQLKLDTQSFALVLVFEPHTAGRSRSEAISEIVDILGAQPGRTIQHASHSTLPKQLRDHAPYRVLHIIAHFDGGPGGSPALMLTPADTPTVVQPAADPAANPTRMSKMVSVSPDELGGILAKNSGSELFFFNGCKSYAFALQLKGKIRICWKSACETGAARITARSFYRRLELLLGGRSLASGIPLKLVEDAFLEAKQELLDPGKQGCGQPSTRNNAILVAKWEFRDPETPAPSVSATTSDPPPSPAGVLTLILPVLDAAGNLMRDVHGQIIEKEL